VPRTPTEEPAPRRRDAEENRARIIAAAREVFATAGFDAPLDAIARRAGVGRATLYRNFPDRYALGAAIFDHNLAALETRARELRGEPDAFMTLLAAIVEQQIEAHALVPALMLGPSAPDLQALVRRVTRLLAAPLRRARTAAVVRSDLTIADVLAALAMVSAVVANDAAVGSRRRRATRALDLLIHGLVPREPAPRRAAR
jgi:AcrR family transcriptional regulator